MPWSATTSSRTRGGQRLAQLLGLGVDHRRAAAATGWRRRRSGGRSSRGRRRRGRSASARSTEAATAAAIRSPTRSAPTYSAPRCAATVSPLPRNSRLLTTVTLAARAPQPGERRVVRLPLQRVDVLVPHQRVEQLVGAGHPRGEADQPVRAGRQPGAEARSGWSRSSTARRRSPGAWCSSSDGEVRRGVGVALAAGGRRARRRGRRRTPGRRAAPARSARRRSGGRGRAATAGTTSPSERVAVRRLEELLHAGGDQCACVRAESDSAKVSSPSTASVPSAAAETRSEKSSEASTPV